VAVHVLFVYLSLVRNCSCCCWRDFWVF